MNKKEKITRMAQIVEALKEVYPTAECALAYEGDPWKLLVMGRLSAQCTDARVNLVCKELFAKYPNAQAMAEAPLSDIEEIVRPCGLYRMKAESIQNASKMLLEEYGGILPNDMDELLRLPGVGRKIANLLLGDIYHQPAIVADTHCIRICGRLGMYPMTWKDPHKVERTLSELVAGEESSDFCHRIVNFGREWCTARAPHCETCPLAERGLCEKRLTEARKHG
jgi:endonuclease-3